MNINLKYEYPNIYLNNKYSITNINIKETK